MRLLEELCDASGFGDAEKYAEEFLGSEILDTLDSKPGMECGVIEIIAGSYQLRAGDIPDMQAVVDRWNAKPN